MPPPPAQPAKAAQANPPANSRSQVPPSYASQPRPREVQSEVLAPEHFGTVPLAAQTEEGTANCEDVEIVIESQRRPL